jgi:hypothetical protein
MTVPPAERSARIRPLRAHGVPGPVEALAAANGTVGP